MVSFKAQLDETTGAAMVQVADVSRSTGEFIMRYDPAHPAADKNGFVQYPDVNPLIEMGNMREAARSYEANMSMLENARSMRQQLIDLLK